MFNIGDRAYISSVKLKTESMALGDCEFLASDQVLHMLCLTATIRVLIYKLKPFIKNS